MSKYQQVLVKLIECNKKMVTFKSYPSGSLHLNVRCFIMDKTFLYDQANAEDFEKAILKDWAHLINEPTEVQAYGTEAHLSILGGFL